MLSKPKRSPVMLNNSFTEYDSTDTLLNQLYKEKDDSPSLADNRNRIKSMVELMKKPGALSPIHLLSAGFKYTGDGDKARCDECGLESSNWTSDMNAFDIHLKQKPDCPYIRSMMPSSLSKIPSSSTTVIRNTLTSDKQEKPWKHQKLEKNNSDHPSTTLFEIDLLLQVRRRTFSHWSHRTIPSSAQMMEAGFFYCNVGDRVICIYCNLICQKWTPHIDDPCEIHKTLSPKCIYVKAKLIHPSSSPLIIINKSSTELTLSNYSSTVNNRDPLRSNDIVFTAACNPAYAELPKRRISFPTWSHENLSLVDDLVRAGFFYTGTKTIVTCFYCNGSLQNLGPNDNPMIKHTRCFPHCAYVKQLCGVEKYCKIQEAKRAYQERTRANELRDKTGSGIMSNTYSSTIGEQLSISDESTLDRRVADRLDLSISQRLLDHNFKLSTIRKCWEDQLRFKQDDFVSECDLFVACLILQKQIEHIDGKKENIVIPSIRMKQIREQNGCMREQTKNLAHSTSKQLANLALSNPCVVCLTEKKTLALLPCGHWTTCVPCGHSLEICPICRQEIKAFVRIST